MLRTEKSVFFDDFLRARGLLYLMYCARTVAKNGEKDAFSVISDDEWNPYIKNFFVIMQQTGEKKCIISEEKEQGGFRER